MDKTNETNASANARDEIIELGVASVDTKGLGGENEGLGVPVGIGIADD